MIKTWCNEKSSSLKIIFIFAMFNQLSMINLNETKLLSFKILREFKKS
ncbi:hypothetical protein [Campylobacter cuniculorum]|uniref:Uncharacterized protein n=1 Tax=Campylobacter cuniculorum TaxID=374106 RepID=A0ABX6TX45_9BACT|nr:hypothetical protein [Campylobacter cuniculorum]QOR04321.1 hypothetical protein A0071_09250 [Campylobacter cuniculorum]